MKSVLNPSIDVVDLTAALCDIESVSGNETDIADAIEDALGRCDHLTVKRDGDAIVASTNLGRDERVIIAGHIDTVPVANNLPARIDGEWIVGRGTVDMKAGAAVQLKVAAECANPSRDVTWVFYDHEEVEADKNGLGRLVANHPEWLSGDFAVLCEPTDAGIEGGCNGTLRAEVRVKGKTAHSARAWLGRNAIHDAAAILNVLSAYTPQEVDVDGLTYREGLNAVFISGGIAGNMIPDECVVTVNYRFAPNTSVEQATSHLKELFDGYDVVVVDQAVGARPGLNHPMVASFAQTISEITGRPVGPKQGWTDVARFSALGIPAVNFGPGDPAKAHADDEACRVEDIRMCHRALSDWLG